MRLPGGRLRPQPTLAMLAVCALTFSARAAGDLYAQLGTRGRGLADQALQRALEERPSNEDETWHLASVGSGTVRPLKTWLSTSGHYCRSFEESIRLASGAEQVLQAIGCRDDDGVWKRVRR